MNKRARKREKEREKEKERERARARAKEEERTGLQLCPVLGRTTQYAVQPQCSI